MNIFRSLEEIPAHFGPSVVTIGNFDGLHLGHRQIMRRVLDLARASGMRACVLTFDPHPAQVLAPGKAKRRIMTTGMRMQRLAALGMDTVMLLPFSLEFAKLTPAEFADKVLARGLGAARVLVGKDFRFGHKQAGDVGTLEELGKSLGFAVEPVDAVLFRGERVSSTAVRNHLEAGEVSRACRLLGGPFALSGKVVSGQGIGSKQTVPTLNLETDNEVLPHDGVYVTRTLENGTGRVWRSITNVGYRPTFEGQSRTIETFLLDPLTGDTPVSITVEFLRWVRGERRFDSPELLKAQILKDVQFALRLHRRISTWDNPNSPTQF